MNGKNLGRIGRWTGLCACLFAAQAYGADTSTDLDRIAVVGIAQQSSTTNGTQFEIGPAEIDARDVQGLPDLLRLAPGASLQTNSRGETLVYLRGAGERQTAVFFDGASLNIPWDNRLDLSGIPANMIGAAALYGGAVPLRYGANSGGGVIDLMPAGSTTPAMFRMETGSEDLFRTEASLSTQGDLGSVFFAGSFLTRSGVPLSNDASLPFSQPADDLRTNTDLEQSNLFARAAGQLGKAELAATLFHVASSRGIAPESDRTADDARFWRYPDTDWTMGIASLRLPLPQSAALAASISGQAFSQTIDSYTSPTYDQVEDRQADRDRSWSARLLYQDHIGPTDIEISANATLATHRQQDIEFKDGAPPEQLPGSDLFRQQTISLGADTLTHVTDKLTLSAGLGLDWMRAPQTGGRPAFGDFAEPHISAGFQWQFSSGWALRGSAARQSRIPTMRELYGTAINRFLLNPDLTAERAALAEFGLSWTGGWGSVEIVPFQRFVQNAIDQRRVIVDGVSLRQRINVPGARITGIELTANADLSEHWALSGHFTAFHGRNRQEDGSTTHLIERPSVLGQLVLAYDSLTGFRARAEADHRGRSFSPDAQGTLSELSPATRFHLRFGYELHEAFSTLPESEIYLRIGNIGDALVVPQSGLPDPGRSIRAGLRVSL